MEFRKYFIPVVLNLLVLGHSFPVLASVRYVHPFNPTPSPPYLRWQEAARTIQDAVEAATPGDEIVVTNGFYDTGGVTIGGSINRVAVTKPVMVRSVNGPAVTLICGGGSRCVYLTNGASLTGFTLTNGFAGAGAGVLCESTAAVLSNCVLVGNSASTLGGGAYSGTLDNCILSSNSVIFGGVGGGGASGSVLHRCMLIGNTHRDDCGENVCGTGGGGALSCTLSDCLLSGNTTDFHGGGAFASVLHHCTVTNNFGWYAGGAAAGGSLSDCLLVNNRAGYEGGGSYYASVNRCIVLGNVGGQYGGGTSGGRVENSLVASNSAIYLGGGSAESSLIHCTVVQNFTTDSSSRGGGIVGGTAENCIIYFNRARTAESNHVGSLIRYSCTAPLPTNGTANLSVTPDFADPDRGDFRLREASPCIDSGNGDIGSNSVDLDGRPRRIGARPDMGAYESQGATTNQLIRWLGQMGLPTDGSADGADSDGDTMTNFHEWRAGTHPADATSALRLLPPTLAPGGVEVRWESVAGKFYRIERSTTRTGPTFVPWLTQIAGQVGTTVRTDTNQNEFGVTLYRVSVEE